MPGSSVCASCGETSGATLPLLQYHRQRLRRRQIVSPDTSEDVVDLHVRRRDTAVSCAIAGEHFLDFGIGRKAANPLILCALRECGAFFIVKIIDAQMLGAHFDQRLYKFCLCFVRQLRGLLN